VINRNFRAHWRLDKEIVFLNHGSFGATPIPVMDKQREIQGLIEREPVKFFMRDYEGFYERAQEALAGVVGAERDDIVFVPNATTGVNTALRAVPLSPGDEILVTNQEYNACRNAVNEIAKERKAVVREVRLPFPVKSSEQVTETIVNSLTGRTRVFLIDHIVSQTALVVDIEDIVRELEDRDIETIVDGAHSVGMVPLNLEKLRPAFFTSNCHKWLCTPKGAAFLYARKDMQNLVRPLVISHGANTPRKDKSRFFHEFSWTGTDDPSAYFSIPSAVDFLSSLLPGGLPALMERNRSLCLEARKIIIGALGIEKPCPDEMVGSMASFPLPDAVSEPIAPLFMDELQDELFMRFRIEIPVMYWPKFPKRLLRISCQAYNSMDDYRKLCNALKEAGM